MDDKYKYNNKESIIRDFRRYNSNSVEREDNITKNKYPNHIIKYLRQREGLDKDDTSMDEQLNRLSPNEVFSEVCEWDGLCGYANIIKGWINDIYGVDLDDVE